MPSEVSDTITLAAPAGTHSRYSIAAQVIAVALCLAEFLTVGVSGVYSVSNTAANTSMPPTVAVVIRLLIIGEMGTTLLGIVLVITGLLQRNRRRSLAAIALIFNVLSILCIVGLIIMGLSRN